MACMIHVDLQGKLEELFLPERQRLQHDMSEAIQRMLHLLTGSFGTRLT